MAKVAIITDMHLGVRNDSPVLLDLQERFFKEFFFPTLEDQGVKTILNLGDTFDRRKIININTYHRSKQMFFDRLSKYDYHAVIGNHDTFFVTTNSVNSVELFTSHHSNFHIYRDKLGEFEIDGMKIAMCPWITKENVNDIQKQISKTRATYLMGHFEIKGFEFSKGTVNEHGYEKEYFKNFEAVYSGHFHHPSEYGNIKYLGAPYEMTWIDHDGKRGFHILDTKTRVLTHYQNPFRLFHKLHYNDDDLTMIELAQLDFTPLKGTYVKLIVKQKNNPQLFEMFLTKLNDCGAADVKVVEDSLDLEAINIDDELSDTKDTSQVLDAYVDEIDGISEDKAKRLKKFMNKIYLKALDLQ